MAYTVEQLLDVYNSLPSDQWIVARNHTPSEDISKMTAPRTKTVIPKGTLRAMAISQQGTFSLDEIKNDIPMHTRVIPRESDGIWKIHISINPQDMEQAIRILHNLFEKEETPSMCMGIEPKSVLNGEHESGKEITLTFDRVIETSKKGREAILFFLWSLAVQFEKEKIKPEAKPPLTDETHGNVMLYGTFLDRVNIPSKKFEASIKFKDSSLSYFYYHDASAQIVDATYEEVVLPPNDAQRAGVVYYDRFPYDPQFKHNPLKRPDDFLYNVVLENRFNSNEKRKIVFLEWLTVKLEDPQYTRAQILDLFKELKNRSGDYAYIHRSKHSKLDKVRLLFKSMVEGQGEENFWHTATYMKAVELLKKAYFSPGRKDDQTAANMKKEEDALKHYVRGNRAFVHVKRTGTSNRMDTIGRGRKGIK